MKYTIKKEELKFYHRNFIPYLTNIYYYINKS